VLLAAIYWYATVGTFKIYVGWWGARLGRLAGFEVHWVVRSARWLVGGMRAVRMLSHKSCSLPYLRYGRVGERVEEVVFRQDQCPPDTLGVDVFKGLERLFSTPAGCCRECPPRQSELRVCRSFGGMSSLRGNILDERSERLRWPQLCAGALDERQTLSTCVRCPHSV
jgi:hypothetical protein